MPLVVHGIIEADASDVSASAALESDEVTLVVHGAVAAVVRQVSEPDILPSRANLLAHTRVLESLGEATTVLPMRFGVVADDEEMLIDGYLAPQQDELIAAIDRLRGHLELRLRGRYDEEAVLRELIAADPGLERLRGRRGTDAKLRLGERVVGALDARRQRDLERAVDALSPHVAGIVPATVAEPLDAFSLSLLVPEDAMDGFDGAVDDLGREVAPALALELVGPLPPFSFTAPEGATA